MHAGGSKVDACSHQARAARRGLWPAAGSRPAASCTRAASAGGAPSPAGPWEGPPSVPIPGPRSAGRRRSAAVLPDTRRELERLPNHPVNRVGERLPDQWLRARSQQAPQMQPQPNHSSASTNQHPTPVTDPRKLPVYGVHRTLTRHLHTKCAANATRRPTKPSTDNSATSTTRIRFVTLTPSTKTRRRISDHFSMSANILQASSGGAALFDRHFHRPHPPLFSTGIYIFAGALMFLAG
jgi:hypothetical protein